MKKEKISKNKSNINQIIGHFFDSLTLPIISAIITSIICYLIYAFLSFMTNISTIQDDIKDLNVKMNEYSQMQTQMDIILDNVIRQSASQNIATPENNPISISANESFLDIIDTTYSSEQAILDSTEQNLWNDGNLVIGIDMENGVEYTVDDLIKKPIVTAYVDQNTGETVIFKGQYDKYNHWDGICVINRYKDNKLEFIMDAEYISGELIRYKQVFSYVNAAGVNLWMVSERENEEYRNSGETWSYFKDNEYEKIIEIDNIKGSDVVNADSFRMIMSSNLEGYYNGYTSNGRYNDNTGQAYLVKYTREGYIRTLYVGKMKDGYFEDETNNAWYIVKEENTDYMYYKGKFIHGSPTHDKESIFINNISIEEIEKIMQDNNFNTGLCWYEASN